MVTTRMRVLLCDLSHVSGGRATANYVPLGIGMVGSSLESRFGRALELTLCKLPQQAIRCVSAH
jgi:hypothetical protein